jgi:hypothetical protein
MPDSGHVSTHVRNDNFIALYIHMWRGLIKILEIQHLSKNGEVLWRSENIRNVLHSEGEEFMLTSLFVDASTIPSDYVFGLDNRLTTAADDTMADVSIVEPAGNGYFRQAVASDGQFTISVVNNIHRANSPIVTFSAAGGSWGPVRNLFLTNQPDSSGFLIASVPLAQDGESVSMRMALSLKDCPA